MKDPRLIHCEYCGGPSWPYWENVTDVIDTELSPLTYCEDTIYTCPTCGRIIFRTVKFDLHFREIV